MSELVEKGKNIGRIAHETDKLQYFLESFLIAKSLEIRWDQSGSGSGGRQIYMDTTTSKELFAYLHESIVASFRQRLEHLNRELSSQVKQ